MKLLGPVGIGCVLAIARAVHGLDANPVEEVAVKTDTPVETTEQPVVEAPKNAPEESGPEGLETDELVEKIAETVNEVVEEAAKTEDAASEEAPLEVDENGEAYLWSDAEPTVDAVFVPAECPYKTQKGDTISVNFNAWTAEDMREFSTTYRWQKPYTFTIGPDVIRAWQEYLLDMCPGEKRHMVIPSEWAWGKRGLEENGVPSHADIIMDVELVTARSETHGDFNMPARVLEIEPTYTPFKCDYKAKIGDTLYMEYHGTLESNGKVFDSSYNRGRTFDFTLGNREAIQGWDQGLVGICAGQRYHMIIPSDYAYGDQGTGNGSIPPGDSLVQDVKCVRIVTNEGQEHVAEEETENSDIEVLYKPTECVRKPQDGDVAWIAYDGRLENTPEIIFDTSYKYMYGRTWPFVFTIGKGQAIDGFEQLVVDMCIGEKRHAVVPPKLAYGRHGDGGIIPPDARLDYILEIVRIDGADGNTYYANSEKNVTQAAETCDTKVEDNDTISLQYDGFVQVTYDRFETTRGEADYVVELGKNQVFPELEKHFKGMCLGEKATITLPPNVAMFEEGNQNLDIAPYATLVFEIEVTNIDKHKKEEL